MSLLNKAADNGGDSNNNPAPNADDNKGAANNQQGADDNKGGDTDDKGGKGGDDNIRTARPDHVPEKFWDAEKSVVKHDDVLKSYIQLEGKLAKALEKPKAPEKYEYVTPEELRKQFPHLPETVPEDDKVFSKFNEYAKEQGLSQEQYSGLINFYLKAELDEQEAQMNAEFAKLGSEKEALQRVGVVKQFAKQYLTKESYETISALTNSAASVKLFEDLIAMATKQRQPADADTNVIDDQLSERDLNGLMKSDAYWDKKHPDHKETVRKVTESFNRQPSRK